MTNTSNLSGDEIPKRMGSAKLSKKKRREILKNAILSFEKEKKKGNKPKKITAKDILKKTGQIKEAVIDPGSYELAMELMRQYPDIPDARKIVQKALKETKDKYRKNRIRKQKEKIIEVIRFEKRSS